MQRRVQCCDREACRHRSVLGELFQDVDVADAPCQGLIGVSSDDDGTGMTDPLLAEQGVIIPHVGIIGGDDLLPDVHGWSDPVAKIVIERMPDNDDSDDDSD